MLKCLVLGSTGLIGHEITRQLISAGHQVKLLARDPAKTSRLFQANVEILTGDVTQPETLPLAMKEVQWVFHAAGMPEQWQADPKIFDRVNRQGTRNVLEAALKSGVKRVIYTSTMDVFKKDSQGRLDENNLDPNPKPTHYERSKQDAEREAEEVRAQGLDVVYLNPSAVYGPSPIHVSINTFFIELLNGKAPAIPPGGISMAYVDQVAQAHITAAEKGRSGERYLLADAHVTIEELAREICSQGGLKKVPMTAPAWALKGLAAVSEPMGRLFGFSPLISKGQLSFLLWNAEVDSSKAQRELNYQPISLREGVQKTLMSLREQALIL